MSQLVTVLSFIALSLLVACSSSGTAAESRLSDASAGNGGDDAGGAMSDSGAPGRDASSDADAADAANATDGDAAPPSSHIVANLTFTGTCFIELNGGTVTYAGDTLTVDNISGGESDTMWFTGLPSSGTLQLSSAEGVTDGVSVSLMAHNDTTWGNVSDPPTDDNISGTLVVNHYDPTHGIADLQLVDVVLEAQTDHTDLCTVNGTIVTTGLDP